VNDQKCNVGLNKNAGAECPKEWKVYGFLRRFGVGIKDIYWLEHQKLVYGRHKHASKGKKDYQVVYSLDKRGYVGLVD